MSMADINRMNEKQCRMSVVDKELLELETFEFWLEHDSSSYGDEFELALQRYLELKAYYKPEF